MVESLVLDVALDGFNELLDFSVIENKIKNGEIISLTRTRKVDKRWIFEKERILIIEEKVKEAFVFCSKRGSRVLLRLW